LPASDATRQLTVAAAADLRFALDEIVQAFERAYPAIKVKVTYGSSGNFFAQLAHRAPFDLYFSADLDYPRRLVEQGLTLPASEFCYAIGQIVVWVPTASKLELARVGMEALHDPSVKKIAIANPRHAPYGRAAEAAMRKLGVWDQAEGRLVLGENIAQTAQFVESGNAEVGIIALSLASAPALRDKGRYWLIPLDAYPRLEQGGVILSWARDVEAAWALRDFVIGPCGRAVLDRYGFLLPGE